METKYPYNQESIARVRRLLEIAHEGANPQAFEVFADGVRLVPRTAKLELFDEAIEKMLPKNFAAVEVKIYFGQSNLNDNYVLECAAQNVKQNTAIPPSTPQQQPQYFQQQPYQQQLGETFQQQAQQQYWQNNQPDDLDKKILSALEAERTKWHKEQLEADNVKLKEEIKEKQQYIESLESALLAANKGNGWKDNLEGLITNGLKIYQTLQGTPPAQQTQSLGNTQQQTTSAHFEEEEEVSEFEMRLRAIIEQVNETFNPFQAQAFIDLLNEVATHRKMVVLLLAHVKSKIYNKRFKRAEKRSDERNAGPQQQQYGQSKQEPFSVVQSGTDQTETSDEEEEEGYNETNQ